MWPKFQKIVTIAQKNRKNIFKKGCGRGGVVVGVVRRVGKKIQIKSSHKHKYRRYIFKKVWPRGCGSRENRGWINFKENDKVMWKTQAGEVIAMRQAKRDESPPAKQILNVIESHDVSRILSI